MGTTLTGTTPQDTYDSLIKVTDNGPLSGTLKALSDGLGNDSTLSLSTTAASIAGTLAVTGNATFDTDTLVVDATNNRLAMGGATVSGYRLNVYGLQRMIGTDTVLNFGELDASGTYFQSLNTASDTGKDFAFFGTAELMRIKGSGNVGIGTSAPEALLDLYSASGVQLRLANATTGTDATDGTRIYLSGSDLFIVNRENAPIKFFTSDTERFAITNNGVTFNGDTAAANALDDYEEGTFSPTVIGTTTAGTAAYAQQNGRYTKIGRLVQFEIFIVYSAGTGTGNMDISGLPFTIGGSSYPSFTIGAFDDITLSADNYVLCWGLVGTNQMRLAQMITGGGTQTQVAYDASGGLQITGTYSV
jgi:hypothetical protein